MPMDTAFLVCINPPSEIHNVMDIFGQEAALNSRFRIMGMRPDINDFLAYAEKQPKFHWLVREYIKNNPKKLLDYQSMYSGKKYFCPAVWENVACMVAEAEEMGYAVHKIRNFPEFTDNIHAAGGTPQGSELISFMTDMHRHITPSVILEDYEKIRSTIKEGKSLTDQDEELDVGHLTVIAGRVAEYVGAMKIDFATETTQCENLAAFMSDLPDEPLMMFVRTLGTSLGDERGEYMPKMTEELKKHDSYLQTADRLLNAQRKGFDAFGKG